jgi:hypothetical protein
MKILFLSIIIGVSIAASIMFGFSSEQTANVLPMLTVWTDKLTYHINDTVTISGYIEKSELNLVHELQIAISNPNGQWYRQDVFPVDKDGRFSYQFKIENNAIGGRYPVRVWSMEDSNVDVGTSFNIDSTIQPSVTNIQVKQGATEMSYSGDNVTESIEYSITVQPNFAGSLYIDVFKNNHLLRTDTLVTPDKISFFGHEGGQYYYYKLTITGKKDLDTYTINFRYNGKNVEKVITLTSTSNGIVSNQTNSVNNPPSFAKTTVNFNPDNGLMVIRGTVYKTFSNLVAITIHNPQNQLVLVAQEQPATDGTFSMSFMPRAPLWSESGNYTLRLTSAGANLTQSTFYFNGTNCCPILPASHEDHSITPLEQWKSGLSASDIVCAEDLVKIIKSEDGSPACVTQQTAPILIERGWGHLP